MQSKRKFIKLAILSVIVIGMALIVSKQRNIPFQKNT